MKTIIILIVLFLTGCSSLIIDPANKVLRYNRIGDQKINIVIFVKDKESFRGYLIFQESEGEAPATIDALGAIIKLVPYP